MNEMVTPAVAPPRTDGTLAELPACNAAAAPDKVAFAYRDPDAPQGWHDVTTAEFHAQVRRLAKGFVDAGVSPGDRVAIMCRTRYEWALLDFALWTAGAVPVPVYETSSPSQVAWIVSDTGAVGIVVETADHAAALDEVRGDAPSLAHLWVVDDGALTRLAESGADVADAELDACRDGQDRTSLATIIYTSGTTGRPKGCELTHGNFLDLAENTHPALTEIIDRDGASMLLFLPMAHVFARLIHVVAVHGRMRIGHAPDIKHLTEDLASFHPTFLLAVPRVFEKVYNGADQAARADGKGRIFLQATRTAIAYSRALDTPRGPSLRLRLAHRLMDALVYSKLRHKLGGQIEYAVSGGAALSSRLGHYFRGVGITVLEGYGLTETTAPISVCRPSSPRIGTVGPPLPGVAVRIGEDGEVQVSGVGVFRGYHDNPEATAEAMTEDRWFRTGDLGTLDEDGHLTITGRRKELLVTAGGKNVAPGPLEDIVRAHPLVSQVLVIGDGEPFISALITIDPEMAPAWGRTHDLPDLTAESALTDPKVRDHIQKAVDRANATVSRAESIRAFRIIPGDFTEAGGHLTPSLKLRRAEIMRDFDEDIRAIYG